MTHPREMTLLVPQSIASMARVTWPRRQLALPSYSLLSQTLRDNLHQVDYQRQTTAGWVRVLRTEEGEQTGEQETLSVCLTLPRLHLPSDVIRSVAGYLLDSLTLCPSSFMAPPVHVFNVPYHFSTMGSEYSTIDPEWLDQVVRVQLQNEVDLQNYVRNRVSELLRSNMRLCAIIRNLRDEFPVLTPLPF